MSFEHELKSLEFYAPFLNLPEAEEAAVTVSDAGVEIKHNHEWREVPLSDYDVKYRVGKDRNGERYRDFYSPIRDAVRGMYIDGVVPDLSRNGEPVFFLKTEPNISFCLMRFMVKAGELVNEYLPLSREEYYAMFKHYSSSLKNQPFPEDLAE